MKMIFIWDYMDLILEVFYFLVVIFVVNINYYCIFFSKIQIFYFRVEIEGSVIDQDGFYERKESRKKINIRIDL